jgi:general secretion pathway protein D
MRFISWIILICYLCFFAGGCAADRAFSAGESLEADGKYEEAMFSYAEAFRNDPEESKYRVRFLSTRDKAADERYKRGVAKSEKGDYANALIEFQTAYGLDPSQRLYKQLADDTARKKDAQQAFREGADFEKANKIKDAHRFYAKAADLCPAQKEYKKALDRTSGLLYNKLAGFELNLKSAKPFTFKLSNSRLKDSFRILSRLSGITFLFDENVKDLPVSITLEKTNFQQVLSLLLTMNKLGCKTLNESTLLVYPRTPEKVKQYEEMRIRTFHLNYMDAKKAVNLVRTMVPVRKIHVNEESNSIVVRDTSYVVDVIEKLLDANDNPDAEVLLDVEVVELTDKNTRNVGLVLSRYAVDLGAFNLGNGLLLADKLSSVQTQDSSTTTDAGIANLLQAFSWGGYGGFVTVPNATYNFGKTVAKAEVLSNPKIRVKNKEKAKFNIGTRQPITTTTTNGTATGYSVNVQYVDVGVKVDAEPTIQVNNDIDIKLSLEVSSIVGKEKLGDGITTVVTIGTRNLQTVLSLKDGETSVIGGLISRTNTDSKTKIFILGDIPLIGPLLSGNDMSKDKTELVLAITPRLVRGVTVSPHNLASFMSGKEDDPSLGMFPTPTDLDLDMDTSRKKSFKPRTNQPAPAQAGGVLPEPFFPVTPQIVTPQQAPSVPIAPLQPTGGKVSSGQQPSGGSQPSAASPGMNHTTGIVQPAETEAISPQTGAVPPIPEQSGGSMPASAAPVQTQPEIMPRIPGRPVSTVPGNGQNGIAPPSYPPPVVPLPPTPVMPDAPQPEAIPPVENKPSQNETGIR